MAATDISGFNGSVTMPSGHGGDAFAWTLRANMRTKDVSRYGGGRIAKKRGGLIDVDGTISLFLRKGAAGTAPGIGTQAADGVALTLTADTGCSYAQSITRWATRRYRGRGITR
jgi:hypothetical protein